MELLKEELSTYLEGLTDIEPESDPVVMGNVSLMELEEGKALHDKIVITLVNVQQEGMLRNTRLQPKMEEERIEYELRPIYLNLYLLFTANWSTRYENAIKRLSHVIRFFQWRNVFTLQNAPSFARIANLDDEGLLDLRLTVDLHDISLEQVNQLWGALGGKQAPSVMYKVRMVEEYHRQPVGSGKPIENIRSEEEILE